MMPRTKKKNSGGGGGSLICPFLLAVAQGHSRERPPSSFARLVLFFFLRYEKKPAREWLAMLHQARTPKAVLSARYRVSRASGSSVVVKNGGAYPYRV